MYIKNTLIYFLYHEWDINLKHETKQKYTLP